MISEWQKMLCSTYFPHCFTEEPDQDPAGADDTTKRKKPVSQRKTPFQISMPQNFRPVSSIIEVDILPEYHRRVLYLKLYRQGSYGPLGLYICDGTTVRVTPYGRKRFRASLSHAQYLVDWQLARDCWPLMTRSWKFDVMGKSLDQVTDMMIANSHNLITVKPANQHNNTRRKSCISSSSGHYFDSLHSLSYPGLPMIMKAYG